MDYPGNEVFFLVYFFFVLIPPLLISIGLGSAMQIKTWEATLDDARKIRSLSYR